jgi:dUTP pyrophosphatase
MFINPKEILDKGILELPSSIDVEKVLQPNGIDLSISEIFKIVKSSLILGDEIGTKHSTLEKLKGVGMREQHFELEAGTAYKVETDYYLTLPHDVAAYVFTRSTLNRNGILVGSGLWDSGYSGGVGTTIYPFQNLLLDLPCRVAQIVFIKAESSHLYKGTYNKPY